MLTDCDPPTRVRPNRSHTRTMRCGGRGGRVVEEKRNAGRTDEAGDGGGRERRRESGGAWWLKLVWLVERTAPPRLALPLLLSAAPRLECGTPEGRARETAHCALWVGLLSALARWCGGVRGCPPVACFGVIRPAPHQSGKRGFRVATFRMNEIRRKPARGEGGW